jgi:MFS family permease
VSVPVRVLVLLVAAIGFLFDTYELLMFPVIGADAVAELMKVPVDSDVVRLWIGRMLWIAALCGGVFGLLGGMLIDRFGRRTIMAASILVYSLSPVCAAFSSELWMLILFRCTTFVGVCVEMVAAVTWLAELFENKRAREQAIGWTLAAASLGGILVTLVYNYFVGYVKANDEPILNLPFPLGTDAKNIAWRYTLLTGLVPGLLILLLLPFVPESKVWRDKKAAGTLGRPRLAELFAPALIRTTLVTTVLSACAYAAAFGALQLTPSQMAPGFPAVAAKFKEGRGAIVKAEKAFAEADAANRKALEEFVNSGGGIGAVTGQAQGEVTDKMKAAEANRKETEARARKAEAAVKAAKAAFKPVADEVKAYRGSIQLNQELGGLLGRILLAILLMFLPSKTLLRVFLVPGIILFPLTYFVFFHYPYVAFAAAIFFCGLLTVAQFSYMSEFLPKVFPLHLRGTGGGFATNVGGRMLGTMAALVNTELLAPQFAGDNPVKVATAAAIIGGVVFLIAFVTSFFLPEPKVESKPAG